MTDQIRCSDPSHLVGAPEIDSYGLVVVAGEDPAQRAATLHRLLATLSGAFHGIVLDPQGTLASLPKHWFHVTQPDLTRHQGIRAALRQDPDVVAVDLVSSKEEAELAIQAALTGHLVLFGVAAPSPQAAAEKLGSWVEKFLIDSTQPRYVAACSDARFETGPARPLPKRPEPTLEERYALGDRERPARRAPLLQTLREALGPHRRDAFFPKLAAPGAEEASSKYGGRPWLLPGERRPEAGGVPLFLALQLDLATLPEPARAVLGEAGHLQLFRELEADDDGGPFCPATRVRVLPGPATVALAPEVEIPGASWSPRSIVGWTREDDYPHSEDWSALGIALTADDRIGIDLVQRFTPEHVEAIERQDELGRRLVEVVQRDWDHFGLTPQTLREARQFRRALPGDKLLGWPDWEQGPEWPEHGGRRMRYLLQVEFDEGHGAALPCLVAGDGRMHLFRSETDPECYAAPWACG